MPRNETLLIGSGNSYVLPVDDVAAHTTTSKVDGTPIGTGGLHQYTGLGDGEHVGFIRAGASPANTDAVAGVISAVANVPSVVEISDRIERGGGPLDLLSPTLTGPNAVNVTVLNDDDNAAVQNALVRIYKSGSSETKSTAANGTVPPFAVDSATWNIAVSADGFASQVVEVVVSTDVARVIRLVPDDAGVYSSAGWIG